MADKLINGLGTGNFDSSSLVPAMSTVTGSLSTIQVTSDQIADYVLGKVTTGKELSFVKNADGNYVLSHDIDTELYVVADTLPTEDINPNKIYIIPATDKNETGDIQNVYVECIYVTKDGSSKWEVVGKHTAKTDLSGYALKTEVAADKEELEGKITEASEAATAAVTTLETKIIGEDGKGGALKTTTDTLQGKIDDLDTRISALTGEGSGSVGDQIDAKVEALENKLIGDEEDPGVVITKLEALKSELKGMIDVLNAKFAEYDERFGYSKDGETTKWKKSFLLVAQEA